MGIFADIERLITEHGSAAILRERLALIADQAKAQEKQFAELQRRAAELERENMQLKRQLAASSHAAEFVEHRGALFKRKPDGTFHLAVYCPICQKPTGSPHPQIPYSCTEACGWVGSFTSRHLEHYIKELSEQT